MSIKERFKQLQNYSETWSFLYNIKKIPERNEVLKFCVDLERKLTIGPDSDIDAFIM